MYHPLSTTSSEFADNLAGLCGRGRAQALALYRSYIRRGGVCRDTLPEFRNCPVLFAEMVGAMDQHVDSVSCRHAEGGTLRFALGTRDGFSVESVIMTMRCRNTLCVSSQVGCRMACCFCRTGQMGLVRNLTVEEIVQQLFVARHQLGIPIQNIVFMGMGEPFENFDAVMQAIRVCTDPVGFGIGLRHSTVATSGDIDGIYRLARGEQRLVPNLAVSLNSADGAVRSRLMPARRGDLGELRTAMWTYCRETGRSILLSYVLIHDINDSAAAADQLADYVSGLDVRINIIPYNWFEGSIFCAPSAEGVDLFVGRLRCRGIPVFIRRERGQSIYAACGQLSSRGRGLGMWRGEGRTEEGSNL